MVRGDEQWFVGYPTRDHHRNTSGVISTYAGQLLRKSEFLRMYTFGEVFRKNKK